MKIFNVKYMYYDGFDKHLGVALVKAENIESCREKLAKRIAEKYPNGYVIKISNNITECDEDVIILK